MPAVRLVPEVSFAELQLTVAADGRVLFLPAPLGEFALRNGLDPEVVLTSEDESCELIAAWYYAHIEAGGDEDPAVEAVFRRLSAH
jgi:hypothetical protein